MAGVVDTPRLVEVLYPDVFRDIKSFARLRVPKVKRLAVVELELAAVHSHATISECGIPISVRPEDSAASGIEAL